MEKWSVDIYSTVFEKSLLGKAIAHIYSLMERLNLYVNNEKIGADNISFIPIFHMIILCDY